MYNPIMMGGGFMASQISRDGKQCKATRYSKIGCNCKRCDFVNIFNRTKPEDCKCTRCGKFHLDWLNNFVCEKCLEEKTNA